MANLTLAIDDELLMRARMRALKEGTSVNAVVRSYLELYAHADARQAAMKQFVEIAEQSDAGSASAGRTWTRDEIYGERLHA